LKNIGMYKGLEQLCAFLVKIVLTTGKLFYYSLGEHV
jgi:hypothetical protein